jgi:hypothetical protein
MVIRNGITAIVIRQAELRFGKGVTWSLHQQNTLFLLKPIGFFDSNLANHRRRSGRRLPV